MPRNITQEEFDTLLTAWADDHILGIESLFNIKLTGQQKDLVNLSNNRTARVAVASCTGSGKTSCLSMMLFLYLMVLPDCRIIVTSPSSQQLTRVFYAELNKWLKKMPEQFQSKFRVTRERVDYYGSKRYMQFATLITSSVENKESLQGGHSENFCVFADEASGISEEAFDILLGTLSTGYGGRFIQVSNPVRSSGRFYQVFQDQDNKWKKLHFSAHDSPNVNKEWIQEMEDTYGIDSDLYRMRVLGKFPRVGVAQYISADIVEECVNNNLEFQAYINYPKIMGVDIARFGDDKTCFVVTQGPKLLDYKTYKGLDTMEVAIKIAEFQAIHKCAQIFIDSIGVGAGTFDRCRELGLPVSEVVVSSKSSQPNIYSNLRAELWGSMKSWLHNGADLPHSVKDKETNLLSELTSMEYFYNNKMQLQLMSKKDLKKMGHESPDIADALSYTFAAGTFSGAVTRRAKKRVRRTNFLWV